MNILDGLPESVRHLATAWKFSPTEELPGGHCCRVFADESLVLKVPFQGEERVYGPEAALKLASVGGPRVYQCDQELGVVLMERLSPGTMLSQTPMDEILGESVFVDLALGIQGVDHAGAMPIRQYVEGEPPLVSFLESSTMYPCFLHGDLHHANILLDGDEWRPIDAKGLVGDRHYECVAFLRNPTDELPKIDDLTTFTERRISSLARALDMNPWRIAAWGLVDNFMSEGYPADHPWSRLKGVYTVLEEKLRGSME